MYEKKFANNVNANADQLMLMLQSLMISKLSMTYLHEFKSSYTRKLPQIQILNMLMFFKIAIVIQMQVLTRLEHQ